MTPASEDIARWNAIGVARHHLATAAANLFMDPLVTVTTHTPHHSRVKDIIGVMDIMDLGIGSGLMTARIVNLIVLTELADITVAMRMISTMPTRPDTVQGSTGAAVFSVAAIGGQGTEDVVRTVAGVVMIINLMILVIVALPRAVVCRWA